MGPLVVKFTLYKERCNRRPTHEFVEIRVFESMSCTIIKQKKVFTVGNTVRSDCKLLGYDTESMIRLVNFL